MNSRAIDCHDGGSSTVGANPSQQGEHLQQGRLVRRESISHVCGPKHANKKREAAFGAQRRPGDPSLDRPAVLCRPQAVDGLLLEVKEEAFDGNAQQNERSGFVSVKVAKKGLVNAAEHRFTDPRADPFAEQPHVSFRVGEEVKIVVQARRAEIREMDKRKLQVQRILARGENAANEKLPDNLLEQQCIRLPVGFGLLPDAGLDGMNVGLRFISQDIQDPTSYGRFVHRPDMLPCSSRSVNRWLSKGRWARMDT